MPQERLFTASVWVAAPINTVFPFFADAGNLDALTPKAVGFKVLTQGPLVMHTGLLIDYRIKLHGVPMRWRTKICLWEPTGTRPRFIDEQLKGPYTLWVHEHTFESIEGGTKCDDRVRYAHRGGAIAEKCFVRPELEKIFAYRELRMVELFGGRPRAAGGGAGVSPRNAP